MKLLRPSLTALTTGLCLASVTSLTGCLEDEADTYDPTPAIASALPAVIEDLGDAPMSIEGNTDALHAENVLETARTVGYDDPRTDAPQDTERTSFMAYDVRAQRELRVTVEMSDLDRYLASLDRVALEAGSAGSGTLETGETEDVDPSRPVPAGWSGGVDNRQKKSTTHNPSRKTVFFSNSCTGALIGPHHVLTAAHCVVTQGTNNWKGFTVRPGGVDSPYASASPIWYYTPDQFRTPGKSQSYYNRYDYAVVIINADLGNTVGWMGHAALAAGSLNGKTLWNRGYPRCPNTKNQNHPAGCNKMGEIWGDKKSCKLGNYSNTENGSTWNANISNSCDISGGQSGSPVYYYNNSNIPVAVGVQFWEDCLTCSASDTYPNRMRRLTPSALSWIATWKSTWP